MNILYICFIVLTILLHFLFQYDLNSSCDHFYKIVFFMILHSQFRNDFTYFTIFSTSIKRENMKIFSHNFFNFITLNFFRACVCLSFVQMLFNKMLIKINMWSNDWLKFDLILQCINHFFKCFNIKTKSMIKNLFLSVISSYFMTKLNSILRFLLILSTAWS